MDLTGIGAAATAAKDIIGMFFPDKTAEDQAKLAASLALLNAQTDIDKTEAASPDPLQHWRGGAGWVCVAALAWTFVIEPMAQAACVMFHTGVTLPNVDMSQLMPLMLGMLGLGTLHVYQQTKGTDP